MKYFTRTRALILVTVLSLASLGGYVGYDQFGDYQDSLRIEGGTNVLSAVRQGIQNECIQNISFTKEGDEENIKIIALTTQECVSAAFYDVVVERGELILRSDTGANMLLVPVE